MTTVIVKDENGHLQITGRKINSHYEYSYFPFNQTSGKFLIEKSVTYLWYSLFVALYSNARFCTHAMEGL
jgi:hypothetical protein